MAAPSTRKPSKKATPASSRANGRTKPTVAPAAAPEKSAAPARAPRAAKTAKPVKPVKPKTATPKTPRVKAAKPVEAKPASVTTAEQKSKRVKKEKVVRDSFTMPKSDYEKLAALKQKCLDSGVAVKKSELLRAGLLLLEGVPIARLLDAISVVETVKTGRPAKSSQEDAAQ